VSVNAFDTHAGRQSRAILIGAGRRCRLLLLLLLLLMRRLMLGYTYVVTVVI